MSQGPQMARNSLTSKQCEFLSLTAKCYNIYETALSLMFCSLQFNLVVGDMEATQGNQQCANVLDVKLSGVNRNIFKIHSSHIKVRDGRTMCGEKDKSVAFPK